MMLAPKRALALALLLWCFRTSAAEPVLSEARTALEKWVETRQLISRTKTDWQTDKETLEQTAQLLERELSLLEEQSAKLGTNTVQVEAERAQAEALLKSSSESLDRAKQTAAQLEKQVNSLLPRLPLPLREVLKPLLNRMPSDPASTKLAPTERMQIVVGVLNEIDKFNNAISVFNEKRKNAKGEEVAVETLYVGLGSAYFVTDAADFAGAGTVGANGWEWTPAPEIASSVKEVIRIYRNERPAHFVALPAALR